MASGRSFTVGAKAKATDRYKEYPELAYDFTDEIPEGAPDDYQPKTRTIIAKFPGSGPMTHLIATTGEDASMGDQLTAMYEFLKASVKASDYAHIRRLERDDQIDSKTVMQMTRDMIAEWSTFPTQQSSASASGRPATGTRSTGKLQPGE